MLIGFALCLTFFWYLSIIFKCLVKPDSFILKGLKKVHENNMFTMGRVDWRISSWPFPPPPFFTAPCQSHMRSSPVVSQRSRTQQYVWKIALPLIIKIAPCIAGNLPQCNQDSTMLMSRLLHMHKPGGDPGVFLNTCWGDLELLGFIIALI